MDINDIREKYPQYSDLSDRQLVDGLHKKFYSDMPLDQFHAKVGFVPKEEAPKEKPGIGTTAADIGKEVLAGAATGIGSTPSGIETGLAGAAKETQFMPQDVLEYIADPAKLTNAVARKLGFASPMDVQANVIPEDVRRNQEIALADTLAKGKIQTLDTIAKSGKKIGEQIEATVSPEMKTAMAASAPQGNIIKAFTTGDFSDISLGKDFSTLGLVGQGARVLGTSLPALVTGFLTKSPITGGVMEAGPAAAEAKDTAIEHINKLDHEQLMMASPFYSDLIAHDVPQEKARELTVSKAGDVAGFYQGLTAMMGGEFTTNLITGKFNKALLGDARTKLGQVVAATSKGAVTGATESMLQEVAEGVAADLGINKTVVREIGVDSFANAVLGAIGGVGPGSFAGATAKPETKTNPPAPQTTPPQEKFIVNEQGTLVPNPAANAAPTVQPGPTPAATPIPTQAQQSLFAPEALPASSATLTPDTLATQTQAGKPIEVAAPQAAERAQSEIERTIFALEQEPQTAKTKEQIAALKEQLAKGPGETLDILKQEFSTLANKGAALQTQVQELTQQRDNTPKLDDKAAITEQLKPLEAQLETITQRQQELLKQGAGLAKQLTTTEAAPAAPQATPELNLEGTITEDDFKKMGIGPTNKKLRTAILGKKLSDPAQRQEIITALNDYASAPSRSANISTKVGNFIDSISQEAQNDERTGAGAVSGTAERGVSVPSTGVQTAEGTTTPEVTGVGSTLGPAARVDGGEGVSGADGNVALAPEVTAETPAETPVETPVPTPQVAKTNAELFQAAGGKTRPSFVSRAVTSVVNKLRSWEDAYSKNQLISTQIFGKGQNIFSFDDGLNNRLRAGFMELARKGDITIQQAKDAMLRATMTQALFRSEIAHKFMSMGNLVYDNLTNRWTAVNDAVNMGKFEDLVKSFAARTGVSVEAALDQMSKAYEANRVMEFYDSLAKSRGEITRVTKQIKALSSNKKRTKAESKELNTKQAYLAELKKNAEDLENKTMHMTRQQALLGMQLYNANPEIKAGTDIFNTMRERAIGWMVSTGVKTQDQADKWLDSLAYVPFQRVMDEDEALGLVVATKGIRENMTDKRMKGSMLDVDNTIGNMYQWMQWSISRAISNQQLNVMLDSYKTVAPEEVREGEGGKGNTFTVYQDGVKRQYNVANPAVAQAFIGAQSIVFPGIGALRGFKTAFTHAFTRLPLFPTAQLVFKDTWEAMLTSGLKQPWMLLKQIPAEIIKTSMGTSEARKAMSEAGVLSTHDTPFLGDANETAAKLHLSEPNAYRKVMRGLDKWAALNDNMLRQAVYAQTMAEGGTHAEAMEKAVEIFNFRRQSGNVAMQIASQIVPFMNAFGQMQRITTKTLSGSGISPQTRAAGLSTLMTTSAVLGMLTFAYAAAVSDDDDYKKMNRTQRDSSFVLPGTGGLRIPIRMGLLTIPKLVGEYLYHAIADKGYTDPQMFKSAMSRAVSQQFMPPIGGLIAPAVGLATNHDFFYDREIVNATQRKLAPELQFNKNTTELSKVLGKESGISPLKLDYFFKSYLGQYATLIALANDSIAKGRGVSRPTPEHPTKDFLMNLPGVGSFMTKDSASGALSDFYEAARDVDVIVNSAQNMAKSNPAQAREYIEKNRSKIVGTQGIERALGGLNTRENIIRNMPDTTMSPDEKAAKIKEIERQREQLAKPINKIRQKLYNEK